MILETDRLQLREFTLDDVDFIIELVNSPGWIQFVGDRNIKTPEQAAVYLQDGPIKSYQLNGFGLYMVQLKHELTPIGMCGIIKREWLELPDVGFAFLPAFTGNGYAFEVSQALVQHARNNLKLSGLFAITLPSNERSIRLLEKLGMKYVKEVQTEKNGEILSLYRIHMDNY